MKKVLLASTALVLSAGVAAADVAVSGDGRMGIKDDFGDSSDLGFTSRIRIAFSASGETDAGLAFGGSIRSDNSAGGASGTAGSVFVEGSFGKISMGDVSGAAEAAVGDVSGVGLTGLGDINEMIYLSNNTDVDATDFDEQGLGVRPVARYDYSFGDGTIYLSASNPAAAIDLDCSGLTDPSPELDACNALNGEDVTTYGIGADYSFGNFTIGAGYESLEIGSDSADHWAIGGSAAFGDATVKATYGDSSDLDLTQWGISLDYVFGATTVTAFYVDKEASLGDGALEQDGFGLGVAYDLGGGAALKGGYVDRTTNGVSEDAFDFGISMSF